MKMFSKINALAVSLCCALLTTGVKAADDNIIINSEVERQSQQLDQEFGLLMTWQERQNLKLNLIIKKVSNENPDLSVQDKVNKAIATYQIVDPFEQRKLLIGVKAAAKEGSGDGNGDDPG